MQNKKIFTMQRAISLVLVLAMLLSGVSQTGLSFGTREVQAQFDSPTITTSISTHDGAVDVDEPEPTETEPPIFIPVETDVTPTEKPTEKPSETPIDGSITTTPEPSSTPEPSATPDPSSTPEPSATPDPSSTPEPSATPDPSLTPDPSSTPTPPVIETQPPTKEPTPKGTDGIFTWEDITIDGVDGVEITSYLGTDTVLAIPATLDDPAKPVLSIGAHALQGKGLTFVTLPEGLLKLGAYAFADNQLASILTPEPAQHIILPSTLRYINEFAFRDNRLSVLDIPATVTSIGQGAFMSNNLNSLSLHEGLLSIGSSAFELNNLVEVWMPTSINSMGTDVFALNGRYVKVVTDNPNIQTEYSPKGFGHVVNPITIVIKHHNTDGLPLISDKILGGDLSIPGEAFSVGVPVTYEPQEIMGHYTESPVTFTPTHDGFVYIVIYQLTNAPIITKTPIMVPPNATAEEIEALLREGLTATDFQGNDITDLVTWTHDIDSSVAGTYSVTYSVTDQWGITAYKQVDALVGTDWYQYPVCNGWVLGDFEYDETGTILQGFSTQGNQKYYDGNRALCLPGFSPNTLEKITQIGANTFSYQTYNSVDFSRVTELVRINRLAFWKTGLTQLDLSHNTKLEEIGEWAFRESPLTYLNLSGNTALSYIGDQAFWGNRLSVIDLSQLSSLTYIGEYSLTAMYGNPVPSQTYLTLPNNCNLRMIDDLAFHQMKITNLDFSNCTQLNHIGDSAFQNAIATSISFPPNSPLTYIGGAAFEEARITDLDLSTLPNLEFIGGFAFENSQMTSLDFSKTPKLTYIGHSAFDKNNKLTDINFSESSALTYIGQLAFNRAQLTSLDLSGATSLTYIGWAGFSGSPLLSLKLPASLQYIGDSAFYKNQLTHLDLSTATSLRYIGEMAFSLYNANTSLRSINFGNNCALTFIGDHSFSGGQLTNLDLSGCANLTYIGRYAFSRAPLQTLNLDNPALVYIGREAFKNAQLSSLDLTKLPNLTIIGRDSFRSSIFNYLDFTNNNALQFIGERAFYSAPMSDVDLSNSPNLRFVGNQAFKSSTLDEVWISPDANFATSSIATKNTDLYTGLYNNDTAFFRTHNGQSVMPSDPNGDLINTGNTDYVFSNYRSWSMGAYTRSTATDAWPWSEQVVIPAETYNEGSETTPNLPDPNPSWNPDEANKWVNVQGGKYIVNPQDLTVYSQDTGGNNIADPYVIKTPGNGQFTVYPRPIIGYCTPGPETVNLPLADPSVTFTYEDISNCVPGDTTGITLTQTYNTPVKPGPYLIGDQMISRVKLRITGYSATINTPKIVLFYDPNVYDESQITIPVDPNGSIVGYTKKDGVLTITLKPISGGANIDIPISWKFKKYVTPEYTPFPLDAYFLNDGGHPLAQANPVDFQGYYPNPYMNKYVDGKHQDGIVLRHYTPSRYGDPAIDDVATEYVEFTFEVRNLERNVGTFTITDTLPTYQAMENGVQTERTAVFDPDANPRWTLSADGRTVSYTGNAYNSRNINIPRLRLRFPWALYYNNIRNAVSGTLTPYDKSPYEDDMVVGDDIGFSFGELPSSVGVFDKTINRPRYAGGKAYFYDNNYDRHLDMPWELLVNTDQVMYNVVLSDFDLDDRLYYSSTIVPEAFIGGTYHLIDANGTSFLTGPITATNITWSRDDGLITERVEFHINTLPAGFYQVILNTRLINPDIDHFDPAEGSTSNVFFNTGSLSYAIAPDAEPLYIEDTEPLYVVSVRMQIAPLKTQIVNDDPNITIAFPGDSVKYGIYVDDQTVGTYHDTLNNFVMIDLMPNGIIVNDVALSKSFREDGGSYQIIQNYNNTGRVGIVFNSPILHNFGMRAHHIATINAIVAPTVPDGDYLNEVFMDFINDKVQNIGERVWDHLQDPNNTMYSRKTTLLAVTSAREVRSFKTIRQSSADPWNYSGIETPANSSFEYSLNVLNNTDEPRTNVVLVDVFPYINDTAITQNQAGVRLPRGSEFANNFDLDPNRSVTVNLPGYSIQYYNSDTPIDYGTGTTENVLDNLPWTNTPAANTIAIRIAQNDGVELAPNSLLTVIVPMIAPSNNDLSLSGLKAYNTFVRKDDSTADGGVNRYLEPNRVYNMIPIPTVNITLTKVGVNADEYLEGAVFELRNIAGDLIKRNTSDAMGIVNFLNIEIGDYVLTEVVAPGGYKLLPDPISITREAMVAAYDTGLSLDLGLIHNTAADPPPIRGSVIIEKLDASGNPLVDFEFTLEGITPAGPDQPGNTHIKMVAKSNSEGRIVFSSLPKGTYRITETRPLVPFHPVPPFQATIETQGQVVEFTGASAIINNAFALRVNKLGVTGDNPCANDPVLCNNQSGSPLAGAKFSIFAADGTTLVDGPLTTNDKGYVEFPSAGKPGLIAYTRYILREVAGVPGYTPYTQDIPFMFNERGQLFFCESDTSCSTPFQYGQIYVPNIRIPQTGRVTVLKVDNAVPKKGNATQGVLEGAEFTIYKQLDSGEWQVVEVITSGPDGIAVSSILPAGVYKIKETKAPIGYARSMLEETFVIKPFPLPGEPVLVEFSYTFVNVPLNLSLIKYEMMHRNVTYAEAEELLAAMAGACPTCKIVTLDFYDLPPFPLPPTVLVHIIKPLDMAQFALLDENKNQLETGLTADGWLTFSYNQIDDSKTYYLRELVPPVGYRPILNDITIRIADYTSQPFFEGQIIIPIENKLKVGQISLSKYTEPALQGLGGIEFTLTYPDNVTTSVKETDDNGYIVWPDLAFGTYTIRETKTKPGYVPDETVYTVEISDTTPHQYVVIYNKTKRDVLVAKVERGTEPPKFLFGAKFALYTIKDDPGSFVMESVTDPETGHEMFYNILYGEYWVKETKAPPGYRLNETWQHVVINESQGLIISFTVEDSPISEDLPDTGTFSALAYLIGGMALLAVGFWFSKRWAKKEL